MAGLQGDHCESVDGGCACCPCRAGRKSCFCLQASPKCVKRPRCQQRIFISRGRCRASSCRPESRPGAATSRWRGGETLRSDCLVWVGAPAATLTRETLCPTLLVGATCVFRPVAIAALRK